MADKKKGATMKEQPVTQNLDEMKQRYPGKRIYEVSVQDLRTDEDETVNLIFFFEKPRRPDWSRLMQEIAKKSELAMNNFLVSAVLPESKDDLKSAIEQWPGLLAALSTELMGLLGANAVVSVKTR
jgi:hypothetical protein